MSQHSTSEFSPEAILKLTSTIRECAKRLGGKPDCKGAVRPNQSECAASSPPCRGAKLIEDSDLSHRFQLADACDQLQHIIAGPRGNLMSIAQSHRIEAALQYAVHFKLASFVPHENRESISFDELAWKAGVSTQQCIRIVRLLMTCYVFQEPRTGEVAHTADSKLLLDESTEAMIGYWLDESFRACSVFSQAAEKWSGSQERNETALNLAFNTSMPKFDFFGVESWRAERFRKAMAGMTRSSGFDLQHLVDGFAWSNLPLNATVVDVGGGGGHCSVAIAAAHPHLQFVVQDRTHVFDLNAVPGDLTARIQFMEYDFFKRQELLGQVYLLRWILHDYSDKYAIEILRSQLAGIGPGSRILVMERIMMPPGTQCRVRERQARLTDMAMMSLLNSHERDLKAWLALFHQANPALRLVNVIQPLGSALAMMELQLDVN